MMTSIYRIAEFLNSLVMSAAELIAINVFKVLFAHVCVSLVNVCLHFKCCTQVFCRRKKRELLNVYLLFTIIKDIEKIWTKKIFLQAPWNLTNSNNHCNKHNLSFFLFYVLYFYISLLCISFKNTSSLNFV